MPVQQVSIAQSACGRWTLDRQIFAMNLVSIKVYSSAPPFPGVILLSLSFSLSAKDPSHEILFHVGIHQKQLA